MGLGSPLIEDQGIWIVRTRSKCVRRLRAIPPEPPQRNSHIANFVREVLDDPGTREDDDANRKCFQHASLHLNGAAFLARSNSA